MVQDKKRRADPRYEQARKLYEDGCSTNEVSRTLGIRTRTLRTWFPGAGWTPEQVRENQSVVMLEQQLKRKGKIK